MSVRLETICEKRFVSTVYAYGLDLVSKLGLDLDLPRPGTGLGHRPSRRSVHAFL